jgi:hypothetical protein
MAVTNTITYCDIELIAHIEFFLVWSQFYSFFSSTCTLDKYVRGFVNNVTFQPSLISEPV